MPAALEYEGLREVLVALKSVHDQIVPIVTEELAAVGDVVKKDAVRRFEPFDSISAHGFQTRVRPGSTALVIVGQSLRKVTGARPQWGALQMTAALLPARSAKMEEAALMLENRVGRLLRSRGF